MKSFRIAAIRFLPALAIGAALACGLAASPAAAQNYPDRPGMTAEQACQGDAFRLCERFVPDRNTTGACLRRNKRALSPECRVFFSGRKALRRR